METCTNKWNAAIENTIKFVGESAQAYKMMHLLSAKQYSWLNNILMYISLALSPVAGSLAAIEAALGNPSVYISITIAIISFLTAVITGIIKFGCFHQKSEAHKIATSKYTSLESNVRRQLQLYRDDRVPAHEYYEWLTRSFDDLFHGAPFIDDHIYGKYYKMALEKGLVFPERYDHFITIERGVRDEFLSDIGNNDDIFVTKEESPRIGDQDVGIGVTGGSDSIPAPNLGRRPGAQTYSSKPEQVRVQFYASPEGGSQEMQPSGSGRNQAGDLEDGTSSSRSGNFNVYPRRKSVNTPLSDLNRYGEAQMTYELRRFMNF